MAKVYFPLILYTIYHTIIYTNLPPTMHGGWQHVLLPQGQTPKRDGAERREKSNEFFGDFFLEIRLD
jgi:hypothetical protein